MTRNNRWSTIFDINENVRVSRQSLNFFAIIKSDDKNYLLLYKQKYLLCEKNNRFLFCVNFDDYKIIKVVDESTMNLIVDDEYTETILILFIIIKFIKQHLLTIINELMTKNYVKLLVVTNDEKNHKNIKKMMTDRAIKDSRLINKMKITLFIESVNELTNFIDLIQVQSRKARDTFILKISSASRSRRLYHFDHSFLIFDDLLKTKINLFRTRGKSIRRMQFIMKFKSHHFFTTRIAALIVDFSTKHVKTSDELFMIETKSFIERKSIKEQYNLTLLSTLSSTKEKITIKINFINVLRSIKTLFKKIYDHVEKMNVKLEAIAKKVKKILKLSFIEDEIKNAIFNQIVKFAITFFNQLFDILKIDERFICAQIDNLDKEIYQIYEKIFNFNYKTRSFEFYDELNILNNWTARLTKKDQKMKTEKTNNDKIFENEFDFESSTKKNKTTF